MRTYRFDLDSRALTFELQQELLAVPGVKVTSNGITAVENAGWIVVNILNRHALKPRARLLGSITPVRALTEIPELRPWVLDFLLPFQRNFLHFASTRSNVSVWVGTGAGKTLMCIVWCLLNPGLSVIVTRAAARGTVAGEIQRFVDLERFAECSPIVIKGQKPVEIPSNARFIIVGYEVLPYHLEALLKLSPRNVAFDEIHKAKSHKRWEADPALDDGPPRFRKLNNIAAACMTLSRGSSVQRRAGFTATPIANTLSDLWAQLDLVEPNQWGKFYAFARRYCALTRNKWGGFDYSGRSNTEELDGRLEFSVYAVPQSVTHAQLPEKRRQIIYVDESDLNFEDSSGHPSSSGARAILETRLAEAASMKREFVVDAVLEDARAGAKQVVFTGRRRDVEMFAQRLQRRLEREGLSARVWTIHGGFTPTERDRAREEYMAHSGPCVLVATGQSMGESVNLHDTDILNCVMLPYTPHDVRQWEGRVYRQGSRRKVLIRWFVARKTVDEAVAAMLLDKLPAVEKVVGDEELSSFANDLQNVDEAKVIADLIAMICKDQTS